MAVYLCGSSCMIWVNIAVPVIKMDIWMYRQSILYIVPIGLSMVITVCSLVPLIFHISLDPAKSLLPDHLVYCVQIFYVEVYGSIMSHHHIS